MIAERGIQGLSMRALAREMGATTGLVSHHFINRTELVQAALEYSRKRSLERINTVPAGSGPFELLASILPIDDASVENWRFALGVRMAGAFDPELAQFEATIGHIWDSHLPALLDGVVDDPPTAARYLVALVDGIALHAVLDPGEWPPQVQLDHLARGFAAVTPSVPIRKPISKKPAIKKPASKKPAKKKPTSKKPASKKGKS